MLMIGRFLEIPGDQHKLQLIRKASMLALLAKIEEETMVDRDIWSFWDAQRKGLERARDPENIARAARQQREWKALAEQEQPRGEAILASLREQVKNLLTSYDRSLAYVEFPTTVFLGLLAPDRYRRALTAEIERQTKQRFDILVVCETSYGVDGLYRGRGFLNHFDIVFHCHQLFSPKYLALSLINRERANNSWSMWWDTQKILYCQQSKLTCNEVVKVLASVL